ncbi:hypothetical protein D1AOALGA4SA_3887 [Olavius algarvensis Delta 1 endosymbiont]|nr:hypothetical protein D1AOALGA4SA_3887 [Olavius algarvensis Delta 1 endosymbiont]
MLSVAAGFRCQPSRRPNKWPVKSSSKDPGPEDPALISPQRGGVYLRLPME